MTENYHLVEWINHVNPLLTVIFLQKLSRDHLFSYLFLLTGLLPSDRIPRPFGRNVAVSQ